MKWGCARLFFQGLVLLLWGFFLCVFKYIKYFYMKKLTDSIMSRINLAYVTYTRMWYLYDF